jgi:hypothetical protein
VAERDTFHFGDIAFPLADGVAGQSLLAACDPARAKLIDFLAFQINRYVDAALTGALTIGVPRVGKNIAMTLALDPIANVTKAEQVKFPLFCIWPKSSTFDDRTANWRQEVRIMGWGYMLPAMTLEQAAKYEPVLRSVTAIVNHSLHLGYDPAYNDGERVVGDNAIASAKCTRATFEPFQLGDLTDTHLHAVFGELEVRELVMPTTEGLQTLSGTSIKISDESASPGNPSEVVNADV